MTTQPHVAVISGGVGAARLLAGMVQVVEPSAITAVVNTGDDTVLHGLHISPDIDTIIYTLANAIDTERGWGLADESWRAMAALERYASVRPRGSAAAPTWFNLGDQDLATHFYRTARLHEDASLTEVTAEIATAWGVDVNMVPMSNDRCRTRVTLADTDDEISFQDYFVRLQHDVAISGIRFDGDDARLSPAAAGAIDLADVIVIAPSNPLVSIGPMRSLPGFDQVLSVRRERCVAVSPIVGGAALKGPADRMMQEILGVPASVVGVAELYAPIASTLIIDPQDADLADQVEAHGMRCVVAPSIMDSPQRAAALAQECLGSIGTVQR